MGIMDIFRPKGRKKAASSLERMEAKSAIKKCCEKEATLAVKIDEHPSDFFSTLIDENFNKGWIAIELLKPEKGNAYIKKSKSLLLSYKLENVSFNFRSKYIGLIHDDYKAIKIAYPEKVTSTQKRDYFRVEPPLGDTVPVSAKVRGGHNLEIRGQMRDISEKGMSIIIDPETAAKLSIGDNVAQISVNLPDTGVIETGGIIRNIRQENNNNIHCGVEFFDLSDDHNLRICRYVINRQREILKRRVKVKL